MTTTRPTVRASLYVACSLLLVLPASQGSAQSASTAPLYEVRNYHFEPSRLDDYRAWMTTYGIEYLRRELDLVGFWVGAGVPAEVSGAPLDSLGSANVTWIIRWESKEQRDARIAEVFATPEWREIFSRLPGGGSGYLRIESTFLEAI